MFDHSKLSNAVDSSSGSGMKCTSEIGYVGSVGIRLGFYLFSFS